MNTSCQTVWAHLQDESEIVHRLVSLIEVVLRSVLVLRVELQFLHNAGMLDETQQDLLRQMARPERLHLCTTGFMKTSKKTSKSTSAASVSMRTKSPVAMKRCVASSSCGEIFTFSSFSAILKMEKSCRFLSWLDTRLLVRLSALRINIVQF